MDNIPISFIKSEISKSLSDEEECRKYRESLEKLLANASKTTNNEQVKDSKKKVVNSNNKQTLWKKISDALIIVMCYGGDWRFGDLRKRSEELLGFKVVESTLRYALKKDDRFNKTPDGLFCLTPKGLEEANQYCTDDEQLKG